MKTEDAVRHLRTRARIQREQKTSYNRLRWSGIDLDAVEALLELLDAAMLRKRQREHGTRNGA